MLRRALIAAPMLLAPSWAAGQAAASDFTAAVRYDTARRVTGTIAPDPDGSGALKFAATRTTYDLAGNATRVEKGELSSWQSESIAPALWSGFTVQSQVDTSYDAMGRKLVETVSSGGTPYGVTQYSYNDLGLADCTAQRLNPAAWGSLPASACTLGTGGSYGPDRITKTVYDAAGQPLRTIKAYGTPLQQDYVTTTYSPNGKPLSVKDANGNKAAYSYDGFDRLVTWAFPSKTATGSVSTTDYESYGYDANGNRTSLRKRDGSVIGYVYDALDRITAKDIPGGTATDVYYGYDMTGAQLYARFGAATGLGLSNVYDGFGRVASASNDLSGTTLTLSYRYDGDGNRTRITQPDGAYFTTAYDGLDRPTYAEWYASSVGTVPFMTISYNAQGRRTSITRGSSATGYTYDALSRLAGLTQSFAGGTGNAADTFTYSPASQLVSRTRSNTDYSWTGYVNVSRTYAANGLNQYDSAGGATFSYDANGNLTGDGSSTFSYDVENRLVTKSGGVILSYDPNGRLWQVTAPGGTTRFLYDGDRLATEYDGSGNLLRRYMFAGEDEPILQDDGGALNCSGGRFLNADERGSIVAVADCWGTRQAVNSYDEYGIPAATNIARFQYTGQMWLPELGMYYYKARIYSPSLGRFLQTDPIGYADQNDLYAYVGNDPINRKDPSGLADVAADCAGKSPCHVDLQQRVDIVHQRNGKTVVDSTLSVTMSFSKVTDAKGNASWSVTTTVANLSGKPFSNDQLRTMGASLGAMQAAAIGKGYGSTTTQMITAIGAVETRFGTASSPGAPDYKAGNINPMQLSGGRANLSLTDNVRGAMDVVTWAGKPSGYDPTSTYARFSDGGEGTMANWAGTYGSMTEVKSVPWP